MEKSVAHNMSIMRITPTEAQKILEESKWKNRPLSRRTVERFAASMKAGKWKMDCSPIRLSESGDLLDGQHRLHAIIKANTAVPALVIRGVDPDCFTVFDTGKPRRGSDVMSISDYPNAKALASAARWYLFITKQVAMTDTVENDALLECVERHPKLPDWCSAYTGSKAKGLLPSACIAVFALMEEIHGGELAQDFFKKCASGVNLNKGNPAYELRERLLSTKGRSTSMPTQAQVAITIKAANAYIRGAKVGLLRFGADEVFPTLEGQLEQ